MGTSTTPLACSALLAATARCAARRLAAAQLLDRHTPQCSTQQQADHSQPPPYRSRPTMGVAVIASQATGEPSPTPPPMPLTSAAARSAPQLRRATSCAASPATPQTGRSIARRRCKARSAHVLTTPTGAALSSSAMQTVSSCVPPTARICSAALCARSARGPTRPQGAVARVNSRRWWTPLAAAFALPSCRTARAARTRRHWSGWQAR